MILLRISLEALDAVQCFALAAASWEREIMFGGFYKGFPLCKKKDKKSRRGWVCIYNIVHCVYLSFYMDEVICLY